ncbi:hypothetical protein P175DRAFT_0447446 [Aspergillus ochraceoroseus IBT 24754]|uniref:Uncharacterized protein n=1 Tax=Aspergillus ochraceoroseus IBT 24754 TaxID=1392256 RepID=A0A2T5LKQ2_9EURO|nr:hypothetical protein P175DRAFT_0447446 [Aspergillus ochraceoroseus IBT 24754]
MTGLCPPSTLGRGATVGWAPPSAGLCPPSTLGRGATVAGGTCPFQSENRRAFCLPSRGRLGVPPGLKSRGCAPRGPRYLVDSASSHMLVSKIKPCMSKYKQLYGETANGSLNQLSFI